MTYLTPSNVTTRDIADHVYTMEAERQSTPVASPSLAAAVINSFHPAFWLHAGEQSRINLNPTTIFEPGFAPTSTTATAQTNLKQSAPSSTTEMYPGPVFARSTFPKPDGPT